MVEQFLPELAEPLKAKCGEILNYKGLNDQLVVFQDKLLPPQEELMDTLKTSSESQAQCHLICLVNMPHQKVQCRFD